MAAKKSDERGAREAKKRLSNYQARQSIHATQVSRRARDNWIAGIVGVVVVALAVGGQLLYFNGGPGTAPEPTATTTPSPSASSTVEPSAEPSSSAEASGDVPSSSLAEDRTWEGSLDLAGIPVTFELDGSLAPQAVSSFVSLTEDKFYDGLSCHRLTTSGIFVLQCGDPNGDGTGGPGYSYGPVENAPADDVYAAGTIAMARQGGNAESQGSQFFIVYEDSTIPSDAAGGYTVVGKITGGLDEITSTIVAGGVEGGAGDGAPTVETVISDFTLE